VIEAAFEEVVREVGVVRRLLDASAVVSLTNETVEALFRELREARGCGLLPSVRDSKMRSNFRFLASIAYDMLSARILLVWRTS
jgi:hypothetical protein